MTEPDTPPTDYPAYRIWWAAQVAKVIPTATPILKRRPSAWRIKPDPGTDEEGDPQD